MYIITPSLEYVKRFDKKVLQNLEFFYNGSKKFLVEEFMDISRLNEIRKKKKISIDDLSKSANLPKSTLEKILFGITKNPRLDTVEAIERALGINEKSPIMERPLSDLAENFIQKYSDLFSEKSFHAYAELYFTKGRKL